MKALLSFFSVSLDNLGEKFVLDTIRLIFNVNSENSINMKINKLTYRRSFIMLTVRQELF
jgi:hypothetical protein